MHAKKIFVAVTADNSPDSKILYILSFYDDEISVL